MYTKLQTADLFISIKKFSLILIAGLCSLQVAMGQDLVTTAAITANAVAISAEVDKTTEVQEQTMAQNATITSLLNSIRSYEKKTYNYLSKAHGAVQGAYDVARCFTLGEQIINNLSECTKEAADHPRGAIVSALISEEYSRIIQESTALVGYITSIVTASGDNNLLNSYERMAVLHNIKRRLYGLASSTSQLRWDIACMRWSHLGRELSPELYYELQDMSDVYDEINAIIDMQMRH